MMMMMVMLMMMMIRECIDSCWRDADDWDGNDDDEHGKLWLMTIEEGATRQTLGTREHCISLSGGVPFKALTA